MRVRVQARTTAPPQGVVVLRVVDEVGQKGGESSRHVLGGGVVGGWVAVDLPASPFIEMRTFMEACGQTTTRPNLDQAIRYMEHVQEEVDELREARAAGDSNGIVDALVDVMVVAMGALWSHGIDPQAAWDIVLRANLAKLGPDGKPVCYRADGGIGKPPGWQPPDHRALIEAASY